MSGDRPIPVGPCPRCGAHGQFAHSDTWTIDPEWIEYEFTCGSCRLIFRESQANTCDHQWGPDGSSSYHRAQGRQECRRCGATRYPKESPA